MNEDIREDKISHLPVPLLHNILFHLPVKEEARTCVLSKSWYLLVWSSLPRRSFDFNHIDFYKKDCPNENERDQKFVNLVEDSLKSLQMGRFKIPTFCIRVDLPRLENSSFLDRWLELVARNHVEEIFVHTLSRPRNISYNIPEIALASSTPLRTLELNSCKLQRNSLCDDDDDVGNIGALALEKISLYRVTVHESFQNFISRCHSLVHLSFFQCRGVENLRLLNNPKLQIVEMIRLGSERLEEIVVDSLGLHTFKCTGLSSRLLKVEVTRCRNLLVLHLECTQMEINVIQNLATYLPHLEKLYMCSCTGLGSLSVLRHPCLKNLKLYDIDLIELDVVDTPNLVDFWFRVNTIPTKMFISNTSSNLSCLEKSHISLNHRERPLNTLWFLQFKTYLGQFKVYNLTVTLMLDTPMSEFNVGELSVSPTLDDPPNVERLNLTFFEDKLVSYESFFAGLFIDGLFWSCRPKNITIETGMSFNRDCLKCICEILLTGREESPDCCDGRAPKCWRHFLKDFAIYVDDETVSSNKIDTSSTELLDTQPLLQNVASYYRMILILSWM